MSTLKEDNYNRDISYENRVYSFKSEDISRIPIDIQVFLEKQGLPSIKAFDALVFEPYTTEYTIVESEDKEQAFLVVGSLMHFYCDFDLEVYLNLNKNVVMIDHPYEKGIIPANSDLFGFVNFINIYFQQIIHYIDFSDDEISLNKPAEWLIKRFNVLDEFALAKPDNFWSLFVKSIQNNYG